MENLDLFLTKMIMVNIISLLLLFQLLIHAQFLWGVEFKVNLRFKSILFLSYICLFLIILWNADAIFVGLNLEYYAKLPWILFFIVFIFSSLVCMLIVLLLSSISWDEEESIHIRTQIFCFKVMAAFSLYQCFFIILSVIIALHF